MPRYGLKTKMDPEEAVRAAVEFFGEGGVGLRTEEEGSCCATFEGGGGFVRVLASRSDGGTSMELTTREWDREVMKFIRKMG